MSDSSESLVWYASHPKLGEIQMECASRVRLCLTREVTLFAPRMAFERLPKDSEWRALWALELGLGSLGMLPPEIRAECTLSATLTPLNAALFWAVVNSDSENPDALLDLISERLCAEMVRLWDEQMNLK